MNQPLKFVAKNPSNTAPSLIAASGFPTEAPCTSRHFSIAENLCELRADGFLAGGDLSPQKLRIALMLALTATSDPVILQSRLMGL
jgi:hypothetical protein